MASKYKEHSCLCGKVGKRHGLNADWICVNLKCKHYGYYFTAAFCPPHPDAWTQEELDEMPANQWLADDHPVRKVILRRRISVLEQGARQIQEELDELKSREQK